MADMRHVRSRDLEARGGTAARQGYGPTAQERRAAASTAALDEEGDREDEGCCTAMIKNIHYNTSKESIMRTLDRLGFTGKYGTIYVPGNPARKTNLGYAFVNFLCLGAFVDFYRACDNMPFDDAPPSRPCRVILSMERGIKGPRCAAGKKSKAASKAQPSWGVARPATSLRQSLERWGAPGEAPSAQTLLRERRAERASGEWHADALHTSPEDSGSSEQAGIMQSDDIGAAAARESYDVAPRLRDPSWFPPIQQTARRAASMAAAAGCLVAEPSAMGHRPSTLRSPGLPKAAFGIGDCGAAPGDAIEDPSPGAPPPRPI